MISGTSPPVNGSCLLDPLLCCVARCVELANWVGETLLPVLGDEVSVWPSTPPPLGAVC